MKLYYFPTLNGHKATMALEEMGLAYDVQIVDIIKGEQKAPEYLEICPNGRIPAMVDGDAHIFESGAILTYLARKSGRFAGANEVQRARIESWVHWQMSSLGPMTGQINWFVRVSETPGRDPRDYAYPIKRYVKETRRLYGVLEQALTGVEFICGDYSIADMASWPWVEKYNHRIGGLADYPNIAAWHARIAARPATERALTVGSEYLKAQGYTRSDSAES